jgi:biotin carboxyl carrier protein
LTNYSLFYIFNSSQSEFLFIILEAMKMEMPVVAPITGTVKEVHVAAGQEVEAEAIIAMIE